MVGVIAVTGMRLCPGVTLMFGMPGMGGGMCPVGGHFRLVTGHLMTGHVFVAAHALRRLDCFRLGSLGAVPIVPAVHSWMLMLMIVFNRDCLSGGMMPVVPGMFMFMVMFVFVHVRCLQ